MSNISELDEMYRHVTSWYRHSSDLQRIAATKIFETEVGKHFEALKADLKAAGYKILYVGACPHWKTATSSMLIAEPKCNSGHWPALWRISEKYFGTSCGNGLSKADQQQITISLPDRFVGKHIL